MSDQLVSSLTKLHSQVLRPVSRDCPTRLKPKTRLGIGGDLQLRAKGVGKVSLGSSSYHHLISEGV